MAKELLIKGAAAIFDVSEDDDLSSAVEIPEDCELVGVIMSAAWTAAGLGLSVKVSDNDANYYPLSDGAAEVAIVVLGGQFVQIPELKRPNKLAKAVKFRSGTIAVPVAQAADRTLYPVFKQTR